MLTDLKYISFLSNRLRNFKKVRDRLYNASCPLCGDSTTKKRKARGYFYELNHKMMYKCHKCNASMSFDKFLERFDEVMWREYRNEKLQSKYSMNRRAQEPKIDDNAQKEEKRRVVNPSALKSQLTSFANMRPELQEYLRARKLSEEHLNKYFFYAPEFKKFTNKVVPGKLPEGYVEEERIIILMFDDSDSIFAYQGREIVPSYAKYVTIKIDESQQKIFGRDRIDKTQDVFVFEGPIDSLFSSNAVGVCGSDLVSASSSLDAPKIYVFDNEPRKPEIVAKLGRAIDDGHRVVIWPQFIEAGWDINDMALMNIDVDETLRQNTFKGLAAKINFNAWKRV